MDEAGPHADPVFELPYLPEYTPEAVLEEIRRVAALVDHPVLSVSRFNRLARADGDTIIRHFGSWKTALQRAGLGHRFSGSKGMREKRRSDEEILSDIREAAAERKLTVLRSGDLKRAGVPLGLLCWRFGTVENAVKKAGLGYASDWRRRTPAECRRNLLKVWRHYGRAPCHREIKLPPSTIGSGPYVRLYGGWKKALAAFAERMENDPAVKASIAHRAGAGIERTRHRRSRLHPEDKRKVPLGLRFQVLQRDRFRCTACGASPAEDPACKLHVDHVVAFSRGGRTEIGNLRTLCALCNLGKGARGETPTTGRHARPPSRASTPVCSRGPAEVKRGWPDQVGP